MQEEDKDNWKRTGGGGRRVVGGGVGQEGSYLAVRGVVEQGVTLG